MQGSFVFVAWLLWIFPGIAVPCYLVSGLALIVWTVGWLVLTVLVACQD